MKHQQPTPGRPGETSQWPRWEGPDENKPSGYLQGEADIFSDQHDHRGKGPRNYRRSDDRLIEELNERLTEATRLDATHVSAVVENGVATLEGQVESRAAKREAEDIALSIRGIEDCMNRLKVQPAGDQEPSRSS
ncbi:BON domain-containing protein [Rhizobium paknamense]|uniref:Osmotically-inducible protein OsmY n=1 Tax=Rhizobium paknamense TaxID=1206817 RepID=A0ABU0IBI4_9HYPH|nr:BON domain-containing protein [Rhizobium paknamense]MDQ0455575.1 osmotically-inducible protein OsmY [Rhizobium paknamense]